MNKLFKRNWVLPMTLLCAVCLSLAGMTPGHAKNCPNPKGQAGAGMSLWYNTPANNWNDALPLGNGRIATMVFGNTCNEEFQLNEETISKGTPYTNYNPDTYQHLDNLRRLIFAGRSGKKHSPLSPTNCSLFAIQPPRKESSILTLC